MSRPDLGPEEWALTLKVKMLSSWSKEVWLLTGYEWKKEKETMNVAVYCSARAGLPAEVVEDARRLGAFRGGRDIHWSMAACRWDLCMRWPMPLPTP